MPGPAVRSPVEEFRRRRRESGRQPDRAAVDPNQSARDRWRQETLEALRQVPVVPRLDSK